jgi:hypothetical protein
MSALHVDVVKNEFLAGYQELVARLSIEDKELRFESWDADIWRPIVLRPFVMRGSKNVIDPDSDPGDFLKQLSSHLNDTYLFATEPHSVQNCPYAKGRAFPNPARVLATPRRALKKR